MFNIRLSRLEDTLKITKMEMLTQNGILNQGPSTVNELPFVVSYVVPKLGSSLYVDMVRTCAYQMLFMPF